MIGSSLFVMVWYGKYERVDKIESAKISSILGRPLIFNHYLWFIICADAAYMMKNESKLR